MIMKLHMLKSKLHRATVTEANLNYVGSITIDQKLMEQANLLEYERVLVVNINNGSRLETYVMTGEPGSGVICLNGAAARYVQVGDKVIIMAFCELDEQEAERHEPTVVFLKDDNTVDSIVAEEVHGQIM